MRSALVKDFNPKKNVTSGPGRSTAAVILNDNGFKNNTFSVNQTQEQRRFSKKRFFVADENADSEK